jgi:hypothetical protein
MTTPPLTLHNLSGLCPKFALLGPSRRNWDVRCINVTKAITPFRAAEFLEYRPDRRDGRAADRSDAPFSHRLLNERQFR